ncbi:DUF2057 family protein [Vibrio gallaecicus]|uniref:YccT family protein n=1 Tax=Vibrio gallaecicus TaxID=552386 RepID=UPI0010C9D60A|nr:DUF2057 domain-containing protein [Vibrio gallaecicus]MDN3613540.1 DUF2057 domain-containing protein [Vibrio gallaecicus]
MKRAIKTLVALAVCVPFSSLAAVNVQIHRDVAPIIIDGESVGFSFSKKSEVELANGVNQLVVRVEKLVDKQSEKEKFNSRPIVLTFNASDTEIYLEPAVNVKRSSQAEEFNENPAMRLTDQSGNEIEVTQAVLPTLGGITRDYEKELIAYNKKSGVSSEVDRNVVTAVTVGTTSSIKSQSSDMPSDMIEYWFTQASVTEQEQFTNWVFENRKNTEAELKSESKSLQMLSYWYGQADKPQRSQILSWLVSQ